MRDTQHVNRKEHPEIKHDKQLRLRRRQHNHADKVSHGNPTDDRRTCLPQGVTSFVSPADFFTGGVGLYDIRGELHGYSDREKQVDQRNSI